MFILGVNQYRNTHPRPRGPERKLTSISHTKADVLKGPRYRVFQKEGQYHSEISTLLCRSLVCALGKPRAPSPDCLIAGGCLGLCLLSWCAGDNKKSPEGEVGLLALVCTWEAVTDFHGRLLVPDTERAAPTRCSP